MPSGWVFWGVVSAALTAAPLPSANKAVQAFQTGLPLRFERNVGQADAGVRYVARENGYRLLFGERELRIDGGPAIRFAGASHGARLEALDPMPTRVNSYTGGAAHWASDIPCWSRVQYREVYAGVDLLFYGRGQTLEYDARVAAGADPTRIRFHFDGAARPALEANGDLRIPTASGTLLWHRPVAYQLIAGNRVRVKADFVVNGPDVTFRLGAFDRSRELTIDPTLGFSTYLGSSGADTARGIALDADGNIYIAGGAGAGDLPGISASSFQSDYTGDSGGSPQDAFLAKLNPTGTAILYITYLGGKGIQGASSVAVDSAGNAYIVGYTTAPDFPVTAGAYQTKYAGGGTVKGNMELVAIGDAFVAKFDTTGQRTWATYLGGSLDDGASSVALDGAGNVLVAGATLSSNFPVTSGVVQGSFKGAGGQAPPSSKIVPFDTGDGFVSMLDPTGQHLLASTYLGGSFDDFILAIAVDAVDHVWVGGGTVSTDFPVAGGPLQSAFNGSGTNGVQPIFKTGDGFVAEMSGDLKTLMYSTYIGGNGDDVVGAIALDSDGSVYMAGATNSNNFPITNGTFKGTTPAEPKPPYVIGDAFVAKLKPGAVSLAWSTLLAGSGDDVADAIALDGRGNVIVGGMTDSNDFPVTGGPLQGTFGGRNGEYNSIGDGFIAILSASTGVPSYSTFLGGTDMDWLLGLTVDSSGNIYATGTTSSQNFASTAGVVQAKLNTKKGVDGDAFVTKLAVVAAGGPVVNFVKNAASYATNAYSPGEYIAIFGNNLGPTMPLYAHTTNGKLDTTLGGVTVKINDVPLPLGYVSATQINALIPYETPASGTANLVVTYNSPSAAFPLNMAATEPALFTSDFSGLGTAVAYNFDVAKGTETVNTSATPAVAGNVLVLFGTGEGQLTPPGVTGQIVTSPFPTIAANVSVKIGNVPIPAENIQYKGDIPGNVEGAFQLNVLLPSGLPPGNDKVVVTIGGADSQDNVTVAIQ